MAVLVVIGALGLGACSGVSREGEPQQIGQSEGNRIGGTVAPTTTAAQTSCPSEAITFSALAPWTQVTTGQAGTPDRWESTFSINNPTSLPALFEHVSATVQVQRAGKDRVGIVGGAYQRPKAANPFGDPVDQIVVQPRSTATVSISADMVRGTAFQSRAVFAEGWLMTTKYWFRGDVIDKAATCPMAIRGAEPITALPADAPSCRLGGPGYPC